MPALRRGFVLLVVLWIVVGMGALTLGAFLVSRRGVEAARNQRDYRRAFWNADGCLARVRGALDNTAQSQGGVIGDTSLALWQTLDHVIETSRVLDGQPCEISVQPSGMTLDVTRVDEDVLRRALRSLAHSDAQGDSLTDALLDWQDADDEPRPAGAERGWYRAQHRLEPRNAPIRDTRELRFIRGFDALGVVDSLFGTDSDRLSLARAPLVLVAALPGMTAEAVARIAWHRQNGEAFRDIAALASELTPAAGDSLRNKLDALNRLATVRADAWIVTARGHAPNSSISVLIQARFGRAGARIATSGRRVQWM